MKIELRGNAVTLDGYVNAVGRESRVLAGRSGPFVETVAPGAFKRAVERATDIELRFNHGRRLGAVSDGTMTLTEDAIGLRATATVADPEVVGKARRGELRGWSFGFRAIKDVWEEGKGDNEVRHRTLTDIDLTEVSILDIVPAYIATTIEARGSDQTEIEIRSIEDSGEPEEQPHTDVATEMAGFRYKKLKLEGKNHEHQSTH